MEGPSHDYSYFCHDADYPRRQERFERILRYIEYAMLALAVLCVLSLAASHATGTKSGDIYPGAGPWIIATDTVYRNESLTVYGDIMINPPGSLTFDNGSLTINASGIQNFDASGPVTFINMNWSSETGNETSPGFYDDTVLVLSEFNNISGEVYFGDAPETPTVNLLASCLFNSAEVKFASGAGDSTVYNCSFNDPGNNEYSITTLNCAGTITVRECDFTGTGSSGGDACYFNNATVSFNGNSISNTDRGVVIVSYGGGYNEVLSMQNNTFTNCQDTALLSRFGMSYHNNTFAGCAVPNVDIEGSGSTHYLYNCVGSDITYDPGDLYEIWWWKNFTIYDAFLAPLPNARLGIYDLDGVKVFDAYADDSGQIRYAWILEEDTNGTCTPHRLIAHYVGETETEEITVESSGNHSIIIEDSARTFKLYIGYYNEFSGLGIPNDILRAYYRQGVGEWHRFVDVVEIDYVLNQTIGIKVTDYLGTLVRQTSTTVEGSVEYLDISLQLVTIHLDNPWGVDNWTITRDGARYDFIGSEITVLGGYNGSAPRYEIAWPDYPVEVEDQWGEIVNATITAGYITVDAEGEEGRAYVRPLFTTKMKPTYVATTRTTGEELKHYYAEYGALLTMIFGPIFVGFTLYRMKRDNQFKKDVNKWVGRD